MRADLVIAEPQRGLRHVGARDLAPPGGSPNVRPFIHGHAQHGVCVRQPALLVEEGARFRRAAEQGPSRPPRRRRPGWGQLVLGSANARTCSAALAMGCFEARLVALRQPHAGTQREERAAPCVRRPRQSVHPGLAAEAKRGCPWRSRRSGEIVELLAAGGRPAGSSASQSLVQPLPA